MKHIIITLFFLSIFCLKAYGQSISIAPNTSNQISVRAYGVQRPSFSGFYSDGNLSLPTATKKDSLLTGVYGFGYTGTAFPSRPNASIELRANQNFSAIAQGSSITFFTTPDNSVTPESVMKIANNGNLGIGTDNPNGNLSFKNSFNNRKIILYEDGNNDHQFLGFGVNNQMFRYQIPSSNYNHAFFVGTNSTNSSELMRITGSGRLGIGTANPTTKVEVKTATGNYGITTTFSTATTATFRTFTSSQTGAWIGTTTKTPFMLISTNRSGFDVSDVGNVTIGRVEQHSYKLEVHPTSDNGIGLYNSNDTHRWEFYVEKNNTITPQEGGDLALWADGSSKGYFDRLSGAYTNTSDKRLKKNIIPLENVMDKLMQLKPSNYQYISNNPLGKISTGFIAQEVEPLFPQFVGVSSNKEGSPTKTMDYSSMSAIVLKAIQEQQMVISNLKDLIKNLESENDALKIEKKGFESRIEHIESLVLKIAENKNLIAEK
ncbi:tail fiber domain-containing protein [Emticicia sp. W12TSBA100-4]|uniref:tail fiber domain-containing protein n=1 Tax=Emticicia sp. W12TSBA100-4 TaxID=3160965 RepID=UPI003306065F